MNTERLKNVIKAIRERKEEAHFDMRWWIQCGSPACALGHYASRTDLQEAFVLTSTEVEPAVVDTNHRSFFGFTAEHFDITKQEALDLFRSDGCGQVGINSVTAKEAIEYIEDFISRHEAVDEVIKGSIPANACVLCKDPPRDFRDNLSKEEYTASGLCQRCQDEVFLKA